MRPLALTLIIFTFYNINIHAADFYPAELTLSDGSIEKGAIKMPFIATAKALVFLTEGTDEKKIESDLIKSLVVTTEEGAIFKFKRSVVFTYGPDAKTLKPMARKSVWLHEYESHVKMDYFVFGYKYKVKKDGLTLSIEAGGVMAQVGHALQRPNEDGPIMLQATETNGGMVLGQEKQFQNARVEYFSDNPDLVTKIRAREFGKKGKKGLMEMYQEYIK